MRPDLERIMLRVQKPARYVGGEYRQVVKDKSEVDVRIAFCFPDVYEIGMSNLGMKILYGVWNNMDGVWCERVFAPWDDMEKEMRDAGIPLYALESGDAVSDFDIAAFSLGYEMAYTAVLNMLDLAGIPLYAGQRDERYPLVIAGGTCAYNPEPLAEFIDLFVMGEGEEVLPELTELYTEGANKGWSRSEFLKNAARIEGIYVPSLYDISYNEDGTIRGITPLDGAPKVITKRIVKDFENSYFPEDGIVPTTEIVHDRAVIELFRGCIRGCRFCQAGYVYRPVRSRSSDKLVRQGIETLKNSGYQEISMSSLSTSDYRQLNQLCDGLLEWCEPHNTGLSLPSLRADNFSVDLMHRVQKVRKSGLTFAPEAGSQRLRDAINKNVREEDLLSSCRTAFEGGWSAVKLYFMMGLPTETDEDVVAIADLAFKVLDVWRKYASNKKRGVKITVSTACFVPKPHTPFQWEAQNSREEFERKQQLLKDAMKSRAISYSWHSPDVSYIEAVLARGDRRVSKVLFEVWKLGGKLDAWEEFFSMERWMQAFENAGVDPDFYACRERSADEVLPWDHISVGVDKRYLLKEREAARQNVITPDCRVQCTGCGAVGLLHGGNCDE